MSNSVKTIKSCRLCGSSDLETLFSLGDLYVSTFIEKEDENIGHAPLELLWCNKCTLVQLRHTAVQELMYSKKYWYESGLNKVIVDDLKDIIRCVRKLTKYERGSRWLDIGANDGTLLKFVPKSWIRYGVEPAVNLYPSLKKNSDVSWNDFWSIDLLKNRGDDIKFKIITAIGMFYDMDDPSKFVADVTKVLAPNGIFIAQLMCGKSMLEKNDVGNICHEHLEYYSYNSLKYLFEKNGLEIFSVEENETNGGSYRLYARLLRSRSVNYSENITKKHYQDFFGRIQKNKEDCLNFIKECRKNGKKVYGYGASTKGNTILQWYGLGPEDIRGIAEIDPKKFGKFTVGTNIPIVDEKKAKLDADYFLVLPYAFKESFVDKSWEWLSDGGSFIFTTPSFEIVEYDK